MKKKVRQVLAGVLTMTLMVSGLFMGGVQTVSVKAGTSGIVASDFLKANGKVLKKNYGNGDTVYLRGTNAGGLAVQEFWMCPTNYSTNVSCQMDIINKLTERFGADAARTLIKTYENNYWKEADFDRCASLGMNCIRLPLWYRNFVDANNNWYSDAFERVDWFVEQAGKRGMYVIIDMHGAYGSQNGSDHSGVDGGDNKIGASEFFFGGNAGSNQEKYYAMWEKLAQHFKGNPTVAGYDLLNEPYCTYRYNSGYSDDQLHSWLWNIYNNAYQKIRAIDPDHLIIMEATWDSWDLPNPNNYGWSNVMYEYHNYEYSDYDNNEGKQISSMQNKINNINNANYNVPSYMGEFNYFNNMSAWESGLQLLNNNGLNWTSWTYKCVAEYGNWGLVNQSVDKVNVESDSYDTILSKWSNVGSCYDNTNLMNVFKKYTPGTSSTVETTTIEAGKYFLTCNDKVVCAENEGNDPLIANRDSCAGAWETFYVVNNNDGTISLKSDINGKYICAVIDENNQLLARSDNISDWEKFYLVHIQSNQYGLRAYANGKYVKADFNDADNNGQLKAASDSIAGAWEAFYFNRMDGGNTQTENPTQKTINGGIEINGYQISNRVQGLRTVYSVDSKINDKSVVGSGIIYSLQGYANDSDLYVGSSNRYVKSFESTNTGKCNGKYSDSDIATSYAMTMKFGAKTPAEYNANWRIRAYAKLSDGSYAYTGIYTYSIYNVADELYQNNSMSTEAAHNYLFTNILSVANRNYSAKSYKN